MRGVALGNAAKTGAAGRGFLATCTFPLTNTGEAGAGVFDSDIYRVSATSSSANWKLTLPNALAAAKAGETRAGAGSCALRTRAGANDDDRDADGDVGERPDEDGHADVRPRRPRHDAENVAGTRAGPERAPLSV